MSNYSLSNISADAFRRAAVIRDQIEALQARLEVVLGASEAAATEPKKRPGRPKGSVKAAAPEKKESKKAVKRKGGKRKISPEGLERIRAAQKARWAKVAKSKKGK